MVWIEKSVDNYENTDWWARKKINYQLFEVVEKWKDLKQLLEWYFSMIEHLGDYDYLINNVNQYDKSLSELIDFSKTSFMEETVWRVSDNGNKEYCWAHLRNLLSPFKNQIALIEAFSEWEIGEDVFKSFMNGVKQTFEEDKKLFLEFCEFLEKL